MADQTLGASDTRPERPRVRVLALHADYRCRSSGVCCTSSWDIPVDPKVEDGLRAALREGRLRPAGAPAEACFQRLAALPHGSRVVLGTDGHGRCVFLEEGLGNLCAIHRQLGASALPSACRDFPRMAVLSPGRASISLSHYCPTAAAMLFRPGGGAARSDPLLRIVEDPPGFPPSRPYEGLDARDALPPLLRPGVLMSWETHARWEAHAVSTLAEEDVAPEDALVRLVSRAEKVRRWTLGAGDFDGYLDRALRTQAEPTTHGWPKEPATPLAAWCAAADAVPDVRLAPRPPEELAEADARWVTPAWPSLARPIRRFLAARAFASWLALQGEGLRTTVSGLSLALGVLRAEAGRGCREAGRALDAGILQEAVRRTDLLLVHLASPETLARRLSLCESSPAPARAAW
jgi:Fe-S-cluster containining protein